MPKYFYVDQKSTYTGLVADKKVDNNAFYYIKETAEVFTHGIRFAVGTSISGDHSSTDTTYGIGTSTKYGHVKFSTSAPKVAGTASAGSVNVGIAAAYDHVHPVQTSVSGSSGSTGKVTSALNIADFNELVPSTTAGQMITFTSNSSATGRPALGGSQTGGIIITPYSQYHKVIAFPAAAGSAAIFAVKEIDSNTKNSTWRYVATGNSSGAALSTVGTLTIQFNGTTNKTFNGSSSQTVNITPAAIGASASSHTHTLANVTDLNTTWAGLLKSAPSAYVTRWPSWTEITGKPSSFNPSITAIPANANLNTYTTVGYYYCAANATVATLVNSPTSNAFFLQVGKHAGTYQRVVEYMTSGFKTYIRNYYNGSWGSWYQEYDSITGVPWDKVTGKPSSFTPSAHTHAWTDITGKPTTFKPILTTSTDWNAKFVDSEWGFFTGSGNSPVSGSSIMGISIPLVTTANYGMQLAGRNSILYFRTKENGTIQPWYTILHSGNSSLSGATVKINGVSATFSLSTHNHDDRYFTETEITEKLKGYSVTSHTHSFYLGTTQIVSNRASGALTLNSVNVSGSSGSTSIWTATSVNGLDINALTTSYRGRTLYGGGSNTASNNPFGAGQAFGMQVWRNADGYTAHLYMKSNGYMYVRNFDGSNWSGLITLLNSSNSSLSGNTVKINDVSATFSPSTHTHTLDKITDLHANWDALLKAAPSAYMTRWPTWGEVTGKPSSFTPSAHDHNYLTINNTETKNVGRFQMFQTSSNATLMPDTGWWSLWRAQHAGYTNGYWQELALAFASDTLKFRRNVNGTISSWVTLLHSGNSSLSTSGTTTTVKINGVSATLSTSAHTHSYLPLAGGTMTGNITFPNNTGIIQNQNTTSNYTKVISWNVNGATKAQIGSHNTGGDGTGSITILPYTTTTDAWSGSVGLFVYKGGAKIDGAQILTSGNSSVAVKTSGVSANVKINGATQAVLLEAYGDWEIIN